MSYAVRGFRRAAWILSLSAGLYRELALSAAQLLPRPRRQARSRSAVPSVLAAPARG